MTTGARTTVPEAAAPPVVSGSSHGLAVELVRHLVVPTFVLDADSRVIVWNEPCERLTGMAAHDVIGTREHWRAFYDAPRPCLADLIVQGRADEIDQHYSVHNTWEGDLFGAHAENWVVMPLRGSRFYLAIDVGPIRDEHGNIIAAVETLHDLTHHKRIESALRLTSSVFDHAQEGIVITDDKARIVSVNGAFTTITGYEAGDVIGKNPSILRSDMQDAGFYAAMWSELRACGHWRGEIWNRKKSGEVYPELLNINCVRDGDGDVINYVALFSDISDIKRRQRELENEAMLERTTAMLERERSAETERLSEARFSAIFHSSPVPMSVVDAGHDGALIDVNDVWLRQFGHTREEVLGKSGLQFDFWTDPADRVKLYAGVMGAGELSGLEAWLHSSRSGEPILCRISGKVFELPGKRYGIFAFEDITAQHRAEEGLKGFNATLENRVAERTNALQSALTELGTVIQNLEQTQDELVRSEKLAALGAMVAGVAHELNTPIGNSLMVASRFVEANRKMGVAMQSGLKRSLLDEYLADNHYTGDLLVRYLNKAAELVSSFKQVAVDQTSSQRRQFVLDEVIGEIVLTMGPTLRMTPFVIEQSIPKGIVLDSFPGPFGQVLTNLINNAVLHGFDEMAQGSIKLEAALVGEGSQVKLSVRDDGRGIPAENLPRIFDPFFTTKLGKGGSGLGLHIVHNIVSGVLGGRLSVDSTVGLGTTFSMTLPLQAPESVKTADS
jgi:PAS domain S-box-containing protein